MVLEVKFILKLRLNFTRSHNAQCWRY